MSVVKITPEKMDLNTGLTLKDGTAMDASDGIYVEYTGKDDNIVLLLTGSAEDTVTVKMGNGLQGVADQTVSLEANKPTALTLESGKFKLVSGDYKGYVHLTGAATTKVQAFELPV